MTSDWQVHRKSFSRYSNDVDYKKLNRLAPRNRVTTAHESYRFRNSNKQLMKIPERVISNPLKDKKHSIQIYMSHDPESAHYFGLPNRPATPMKTIMNGTYGNVAEFDMLNRNQKIVRE